MNDLVSVYLQSFPFPLDQAVQIRSNIQRQGVDANWFFTNCFLANGLLAQGDLVSGIHAVMVDISKRKTQALSIKNSHAIVITNTCDNTRADYFSFVPLMEADEYFSLHESNTVSAIKNNVITSLLYLPATNSTPAFVGDLAWVSTMTEKSVKALINRRTIKRAYSLTTQGYYYLLAKLTLHWMRPEGSDVNRPGSPQ
jgi:hypothetical protein